MVASRWRHSGIIALGNKDAGACGVRNQGHGLAGELPADALQVTYGGTEAAARSWNGAGWHGIENAKSAKQNGSPWRRRWGRRRARRETASDHGCVCVPGHTQNKLPIELAPQVDSPFKFSTGKARRQLEQEAPLLVSSLSKHLLPAQGFAGQGFIGLQAGAQLELPGTAVYDAHPAFDCGVRHRATFGVDLQVAVGQRLAGGTPTHATGEEKRQQKKAGSIRLRSPHRKSRLPGGWAGSGWGY